MDAYEAMGRLARVLEPRIGWAAVSARLDGICELPTRTEMEEAVCWLARDYGLLDVIAGEEVASTETERALQVA